MGIRRNFRDLSAADRALLVQGLYHVKTTGIVDQFADMHAKHFQMGIHRTSHFLPWHREMILRFEHALQEYDPRITIPYWDSSVEQGRSGPLWRNDFMGQFNGPWHLSRTLGADTLPTPEQVEATAGRTTYPLFWPDLESAIHNPPHRWVGGEMAGFASPSTAGVVRAHGCCDLRR